MADDWIKMRANLDMDPDVIDIAAALNIDVDLVIGKLFRLWKWADQQTTNGHIKHVTFGWIDAHLRCETFSEKLKKVGWLSVTPDGIRIPKFTRHNGQSAKRRALTARRVAKYREKNSNAQKVTKRLPEKRREEERRGFDGVPSNKNTFAHSAEVIFAAYPRKVSKTPALKAIEKAIAKLSKRPEISDAVEWLRQKTIAFAAARTAAIEADPSAAQFTKYPATWFNQGCYDDNPAEWGPVGELFVEREPTPEDIEYGECSND